MAVLSLVLCVVSRKIPINFTGDRISPTVFSGFVCCFTIEILLSGRLKNCGYAEHLLSKSSCIWRSRLSQTDQKPGLCLLAESCITIKLLLSRSPSDLLNLEWDLGSIAAVLRQPSSVGRRTPLLGCQSGLCPPAPTWFSEHAGQKKRCLRKCKSANEVSSVKKVRLDGVRTTKPGLQFCMRVFESCLNHALRAYVFVRVWAGTAQEAIKPGTEWFFEFFN